MLSYEETMAVGAAEYADVLDGLRGAGFPALFTQTGGMNAAIESVLEGGGRLLATDAEDALAWSRADHQAWAVGAHAPGEGADPTRFVTSVDGGVAALIPLVRRALTRSVTRRVGRGVAEHRRGPATLRG